MSTDDPVAAATTSRIMIVAAAVGATMEITWRFRHLVVDLAQCRRHLVGRVPATIITSDCAARRAGEAEPLAS
jgi:hypothetical protein